MKNLLLMDAGAIVGLVVLAVVLLALIVVIIRCFTIVPQAHTIIVERLGKYNRTLEAGFHATIPFIEKRVSRVSLKEKVADFPPQPVITKDNVTMQIDTVVYYQITDPRLYTYGVERPMSAIENLTATTLRNLIGDLELDQTLTSRDTINHRMRSILDEATDPWGIKVNRVELKNILHRAIFRKRWKSKCAPNVRNGKRSCRQTAKSRRRFFPLRAKKKRRFSAPMRRKRR